MKFLRTTPSVWCGLVPSPSRSSNTIRQGFWDGRLFEEDVQGTSKVVGPVEISADGLPMVSSQASQDAKG